MDHDDTTRIPPRLRFLGSEHMLDLGVETERLREETGNTRDGHRQITLFHRGGLSIILFDFDTGGFIKNHAADGFVAIQVLSGEIGITSPTGEYQMPAGALLVLEPGIRHDVQAFEPSRMLLTVRLEQAQTESAS